jgi:hypothetical protein
VAKPWFVFWTQSSLFTVRKLGMAISFGVVYEALDIYHNCRHYQGTGTLPDKGTGYHVAITYVDQLNSNRFDNLFAPLPLLSDLHKGNTHTTRTVVQYMKSLLDGDTANEQSCIPPSYKLHHV